MDEAATNFKYENGVLHISASLQTLRIRWDGIPEAAERTHSGKWRDCSPEIRLLKPATDCQREGERARVFEAFRASIPQEITRLVEPFASHQWNMMVLLRYSKEASDLAVSNSVLAYALANNNEIRNTSPRSTMYHAMRNVRKKQRDICDSLGYPASEACVRLFRKIPVESCSPSILRILRIALKRDPEILTVLGHLKHIHPSIIYLVGREDVFRLVTPKLLLQVSEVGENAEDMHVSDMLYNVVYHASRMARPPVIPRFLSVRGVQEFHGRMMLEMDAEKQRLEQARQQIQQQQHQEVQAVRRRRTTVRRRARRPIVFPPPPLPGTDHIVPITIAAELRIEGRQQHNCVGSYAHMVESGKYYVYKVLQPQRATLSIRKGPGGTWYISELRCTCNQAVAKVTRNVVSDWLDQHNVSL